jgi:hypothetical protein
MNKRLFNQDFFIITVSLLNYWLRTSMSGVFSRKEKQGAVILISMIFITSPILGESYFFVNNTNHALLAQTSNLISKDNSFLHASNDQQNIPNKVYEFQEQGQYDTGLGPPVDVFVQGDFVFTANEWGGLVIFDISNHSNPVVMSSFDLDRTITETQTYDNGAHSIVGVFVIGKTVFLADGTEGLVILDISNPYIPKLMSIFQTGNGCYQIVVEGDYAYAYSGVYEELFIIDISDPSHPSLVQKLDFKTTGTPIIDICVKDGYFYYISSDFVTLDVRDPRNPLEVSRIENLKGRKISAHDNYIFVASPTRGLLIFDGSNPSSPILCTEFALELSSTYGLYVSTTSAYIAGKEKIVSLDITNITSPVQQSVLTNLGSRKGIKEVCGRELSKGGGTCSYVLIPI